MASIDQIQGGSFQDPAGNAVNGGSISFTLSAPAQTLNDGQAVQDSTVTFPLNSTGSVALTNLWGNDQLTPVGTYYIIKIYNANGALVRGPENWAIIGNSPIDLGTIVAFTPMISYPVQAPSELAIVSLTGQSAAITQASLVAVLGLTGRIRISWNAKVTTAASTNSSLGPLTIFYTDADGTATSVQMAEFHVFSGNLVSGGAARVGNGLTTGMIGIPAMLNCLASSALTYSFGYGSNGGTAMQYELLIVVEQM
ncbi:MAG: hypothetical protein JWQ87_5462 [Candidatus Sulfotelmatobacter sp.]|nr:hypothetical protein [Candidatus Sulfotelmatobacter sp.]